MKKIIVVLVIGFFCIPAVSFGSSLDDASLGDLIVNGSTVTGYSIDGAGMASSPTISFSPSIYNYNVALSAGTTVLPTVGIKTNDPYATAIVTQTTGLPGQADVLVTAQDRVTQQRYVIRFMPFLSVRVNDGWPPPISKTGVKLGVALFSIFAGSPSIAWRQISVHPSLSPGVAASNWILQDNSNTAYTDGVTAVQNGDVVTFTAPADMPVYNNTSSGVGYTVYATITGVVTSAPTVTAHIDSSDFVWNGSYIASNGVYTAPVITCTSFGYSAWSSCSSGGNQTRNVISSSPNSCTGGSPVLSQSCTYTPPLPSCTAADWSCANWGICSQNSSQTRTCAKNANCQGGASSPTTSQSCAYIAPVPSCTSFYYSGWSECSSDGKQTRNVTSKYPYNCEGGEYKTIQSCTYIPPAPTCDADTWTCGDWNSCSLSGIQNRSCRKTFDCSIVETAPPITDQYCEAPNRPAQQIPQNSSDEISNQDAIIKSTVKLGCPFDENRVSWGSGTIIDSNGTILTNKHVIAGTLGCWVGFINDFNDEPYFGERQIADIAKVSPNQDIAILKIRNPQNKNLTSVNITKGSSNLRLGTKVTTYGFPAKFGTKVTYTSGDFSGTDGNYIKTTAILEYGNSGGGAYLKDGTFIGIPSAVVRGELNALGYILSINTINSWLGNSSITYGGTNNNNYSRVSVLEDIDIKKLGSLKLFIPDTDAKGNLAVSITNKNVQKTTEQPKINQTQKESIIIESTDTNQKINPEQNNPASIQNESQQKPSLVKRFVNWFVNLFK